MTILEAYAEITMVYRKLHKNKKVDLKKFMEAIDALRPTIRRTAHMRASLKTPKHKPEPEGDNTF